MLPQVFLESVRLFLTQRRAEVGAAVFDKDDALAVEFVTAAANLRSAVYGIPTQTLFAAKARSTVWMDCLLWVLCCCRWNAKM